MSPRSFIAFSCVTLLLVIGAIAAIASRPSPTEIPKNRPLVFENLDKKLNDVGELRIELPSRSFTISRTADGWGIKELNGYPVIFDRIKTVLVQLSSLRYLEPKTSDPARYDRLELRDVTVEGSKARKITVVEKGGDVLASGLVGRRNDDLFGEGKGGTYMRFGDKKQTWLIEGAIDLGKGPADWVSQDIMDIKDTAVRRLEITSPSGGKVVIWRDAADKKDFTLDDIPAGKRQRGQWETNDMAKVLDGLKLKDIKLEKDAGLGENAYTGKITLFDGLVIETKAIKSGKTFWAGFSATTTDAADEAAKKRAAAINERLKGYAFEIDEKPGKKLACEHINLLEGAGIKACA